MVVKQLKINVNEALILDVSLKGRDEDITEFRWFLKQVGQCLISKKDKVIGVEEEDLWLLRDKVNPLTGRVAFELIEKIYSLLLDDVTEGLEYMPEPSEYAVEKVDAGNKDKDSTQERTSTCTRH